MFTQAQRLFNTGRRFTGTDKDACGKCGYRGLNINLDIIGQDGSVMCVSCWNEEYSFSDESKITEAWLYSLYGEDPPIETPPNALETCNSCDFRPMALGDNPMGYCLPCLAEVMGADDNGR